VFLSVSFGSVKAPVVVSSTSQPAFPTPFANCSLRDTSSNLAMASISPTRILSSPFELAVKGPNWELIK
jgi:hypothetical protein